MKTKSQTRQENKTEKALAGSSVAVGSLKSAHAAARQGHMNTEERPMETITYMMSAGEAKIYDSGDDDREDELDREFEHRFGWCHPIEGCIKQTEIYHPDGSLAQIRYE